jgi:uncharacterized protein YjbI with pentapeptide repeats
MIIIFALNPESSPSWTGFGKYDDLKQGPRFKTLWDWLDLLIIPLVLSGVAWFVKSSNEASNVKKENERSKNNILDNYITVMTELVLNRKIISSEEDYRIAAIARTRTILALENLDGSRKGQVIQFLYETSLISANPIIDLNGMNIRDAEINNIVLTDAEIRGAYFNNSSLINANLEGAILIGSDFENSNLSGTKLKNTDLSFVNFTKAKLTNIDFTTSNLRNANFTNAVLKDSQLTNSQYNSIKSNFDKVNLINIKVI